MQQRDPCEAGPWWSHDQDQEWEDWSDDQWNDDQYWSWQGRDDEDWNNAESESSEEKSTHTPRQDNAERRSTAPRSPQLERLRRIVDRLEKLAHAGLPTMIAAFHRGEYTTKLHHDFHTDEAALAGSLLCPY